MSTPVLFARQAEMESACLAEGAKRFRDRALQASVKGRAAQVDGGAHDLLRIAVERLEPVLEAFLEEEQKKHGKRHRITAWLEQIGPDTAAFLTCRSVLDGVGLRFSLHRAATEISARILDELRFRRFREVAPGLFEYRMAKFTTGNYQHRARSLAAAVSYAQVDISDLQMTQEERFSVGAKLIDLMHVSTDLFTLENTIRPMRGRNTTPKRECFLVPTEATVRWIEARTEHLAGLEPMALPMVVPPLAWDKGQVGGYRYAMRGRYAFVRGQRTVEPKLDTPVVYKALNAVQDTAWKVNGATLALVLAIRESGRSMAGLPAFEPVAEPPKPLDFADSETARKAWRKKAHAVKEENYQRKITSVWTGKVISTAIKVRDEAAIYFPFTVDFRGRLYPVADYLSPQGNDLCRSLLLFAQGKPLGEDGVRWLAYHAASCLGEYDGQKVSHMTLDERLALVTSLSQRMAETAAEPMADLWWTEAEKPLQFYAACVEWAGYVAQGESYVCSMPVGMDGTCNGLQHFAAALRDPQGGAAVNLVPQERPQDVYADIASRVTALLTAEAARNPLAQKWLDSGLVDRKLCKRPTMTFGYGSGKFGFAEQIREDLESRDNWPAIKVLFTGDRNGKASVQTQEMAALAARHIWTALADVVVAAFGARKWLQDCARVLSKENKPVKWTVPVTGFKVSQRYFRQTKRQLKTIIAGTLVRPLSFSNTDKVDGYRQANGIAPNVIHSLDAAALMLAVTQAAAEGVESFGMIHDSYSTIPADAAVLARAARFGFVKLYRERNVFGELGDQFQAQVTEGTEMPPLPPMGTLDISAVLASPYFFS